MLEKPIRQDLKIMRRARIPRKPDKEINSSIAIKTLHNKWSKAVKVGDIRTMLKIGGKLLQTLEKRRNSFALHRIEILEQLAELKFQTAVHRDAWSYYYALRHLDTKLYGSSSLEVFQDNVHLGETAFAQGEIMSALKIYRKLLVQAGRLLGKRNPYFAIILSNLAGIYYTKKNYGEAIALYERALKINELHYKMKHKSVAINLYNLGLTYEARGKGTTAVPLYQQAREIGKKVFKPDDPWFKMMKAKTPGY